MSRNQHTKHDHRRIIELMLANNPASVVAERMGCTRKYVSRVWCRYKATGVMPPKRPADATQPNRYTPEQLAWIRKNYPHDTTPNIAEQFNRRYGQSVKPEQIYALANKMGVRKTDEHLSGVHARRNQAFYERQRRNAEQAVAALEPAQRARLAAMLAATTGEWRRYLEHIRRSGL